MQRIRIRPRSTEAKRLYNGKLAYGSVMYVDEKQHEWKIRSADGRIEMWIHPTDDPDWEIIR
jgi:hypothetical protein